MKRFLVFAAIFGGLTIQAQEHHCALHKQQSVGRKMRAQMAYKKAIASAAQISHEHKYDMTFVHLDVQVERNNKNIGGRARIVAKAVGALDTFMTILHLNHVIDSARFNGVPVTPLRQDSMVKIGLASPVASGTSFTADIYYKGTAPSGGGAIGSGFSNGTSPSWGNQATWSLSESFVAYHWWPCKQVLTDKIDSSWVFITTDSTNMAGSNGLLTNVTKIGNKKRYEWKSRYPIDYYLISVAVAKYKEYRQYAKPQYLGGDSILIQNFIYDNAINHQNWINGQKPDLDQLPRVMEFLCDMYGMYPFYEEKYGNCMAPLSGGMEHQTMTTQGFFEYYINAHELGHHWWGDQVTCKSWGDIWINEGFASYTEHLVAQYLDPGNFHQNLDAAHNTVMSQSGGSVKVPLNDTMNTPRIFSSRLTYDKGGAIVHTLRFLTNNDSLWFNALREFQKQYKHSTASAYDFFNVYQTYTGVNPSLFVSQWYEGQGYPTFNMKYNFDANNLYLKVTQSVSMPAVTPLFVTPVEYKVMRGGKADTTIRLMHSNTVESYTIPLSGIITGIVCDPNNWLINKSVGPARDLTLGPQEDISGLAAREGFEFRIGPNPVTEKLHLLAPDGFEGQFKIYSVSGALLKEGGFSGNTSMNATILAKGIYLLEITDRQGAVVFTQKFVRE